MNKNKQHQGKTLDAGTGANVGTAGRQTTRCSPPASPRPRNGHLDHPLLSSGSKTGGSLSLSRSSCLPSAVLSSSARAPPGIPSAHALSGCTPCTIPWPRLAGCAPCPCHVPAATPQALSRPSFPAHVCSLASATGQPARQQPHGVVCLGVIGGCFCQLPYSPI